MAKKESSESCAYGDYSGRYRYFLISIINRKNWRAYRNVKRNMLARSSISSEDDGP